MGEAMVIFFMNHQSAQAVLGQTIIEALMTGYPVLRTAFPFCSSCHDSQSAGHVQLLVHQIGGIVNF
jgi:hypothetical protein